METDEFRPLTASPQWQAWNALRFLGQDIPSHVDWYTADEAPLKWLIAKLGQEDAATFIRLAIELTAADEQAKEEDDLS